MEFLRNHGKCRRALRICKKLNIIGPRPLRDPGEGLRQRTQSQIWIIIAACGEEEEGEPDVPFEAM